MIDAATLRRLFRYDPDTGLFIRLKSTHKNAPAGVVAGGRSAGGYIMIAILGRRYYGHRLAWLYMTGQWPAAQIDHINCVRSDNRWSNLRAATHQQNHWNVPRHRDGKSGIKGVCFARGTWRASICVNGKLRHLGVFPTAELAQQAYQTAAKDLHGEFARLA